MVGRLMLMSGTGHPSLAKDISQRLGVPLSVVNIKKFSNLETSVEIQDSVRGMDVFLLQSFHGANATPEDAINPTTRKNVNQLLMELLILINACKIASASKVTVVLPYFPYSKQPSGPYDHLPPFLPKGSLGPERCSRGTGSPLARSLTSLTNGSCSATPSPSTSSATTSASTSSTACVSYRTWSARSGKLIANLLMKAGADHIVTMDLHDPQYEGFFDIPVDNLRAEPVFLRYILDHFMLGRPADVVIVSPDAGGAKRALSISEKLGVDFALVHKEHARVGKGGSIEGLEPSEALSSPGPDGAPCHNSALTCNLRLVGDVAGRTVILVDDIADSCNTLIKAADLCINYGGAARVSAVVSHGLFSDPDALTKLMTSSISELIVSNSIPPLSAAYLSLHCPKVRVISIAPLFAEAIRRSHYGESVSQLFDL